MEFNSIYLKISDHYHINARRVGILKHLATRFCSRRNNFYCKYIWEEFL